MKWHTPLFKGGARNIQAEKQRAEEAQAKSDAKGVGTEALSDIKDLGASRAQAEQARQAVTQLDQGHSEGARQLEGILTQLVGTAKNLTQGQRDMFALIMKKLEEVTHELESHHATLNKL